MTNSSDLDKFLAPRTFSAYLFQPGKNVEVTVVMPDLRRAPRHCWGDWGPIYTIQMLPKQHLELHYHEVVQHLESVVHLSDCRLHLESPMLFMERRKYPFILSFEDVSRGMRFAAHMCHDGRICRAEITPTSWFGDVRPLFSSNSGNRVASL